jgi:hypothetical protein
VRNKGILLAALSAVFLAALPLAADTVIQRGIDSFTTTADGRTFYDFKAEPIPAGFFCRSSAPFTGRVVLKGVPLETGAPGQLHGADTVIERLDDAAFDASGTAQTRIRFRALSLASISPIKTACGAYHVYVTLAGEQRVTTMRIERTEEKGGSFVAPLAVDARMTFVPVRRGRAQKAKLELVGSFTFPATQLPWSTEGGPRAKRAGSATIDTNGDFRPDTLVSGTSNFWPGWLPGGRSTTKVAYGCWECEPPTSCHTDSYGKQHCTGGVVVCNGAVCP